MNADNFNIVCELMQFKSGVIGREGRKEEKNSEPIFYLKATRVQNR